MLLFLNVGGSEVIVIALFVLMFFGSKQIPELMRGLGKGMRELKDAMNGIEREVRDAVNVKEEPKPVEKLKEIEGTAPTLIPPTLSGHAQGSGEKNEEKKGE
jgi:sec-independent protein translocase protein TatA